MSGDYDVIIVGAGHNGLVCAAVLGEKGKKVLVLEAGRQVGGLASTREFAPGCKVSAGAHLLYGLHPEVHKQCGLATAGPEFTNENVATIVTGRNRQYIRFTTGSPSDLRGSPSPGQEEVDRWIDFHERMEKFSNVLFGLAGKAPPRLKNGSLTDYRTLLSTGLELRRLGTRELREFLRIVGMNIYDLAEENLTSSLLGAAVSWDAILGTRLGPRAPNTVYNWLNRKAIADRSEKGLSMPVGGMGALSQALKVVAQNRGAEVRTNSKVTTITVSDNRVTGVETEDGEHFSAGKIISNADIRNTMLSLVGAKNLETDFVRRVNWIPMKGNTAKLHLALNRLPESFTGDESDFSARVIHAPDTDTIERASNSIKYGEYPEEPVFEITVPSTTDSSLMPDGKHVMSVLVPYIPYQHKNGWDKEHENFENHMIGQLDRLMPGLTASIEFVETLTPLDIERQFNVTGGHWHHGDIGLERFLMTRPVPGYSQYATPISGLYLCGADCHPGGDVTGTAGLNAAHAVLRG